MSVLTPVIGIPNYFWKKKAVKYARKNPSIVTLEMKDLCYECDRHRELLNMFDDGRVDYKNSSYFKYGREMSCKIEEVVLKKIGKFKKLYLSMKEGIYECPQNRMPIITEDGCRLDGSHKLTILEHIGCREVEINVFIYSKIFSKLESKKIISDNLIFRKETYNL